MTKIRLEIDGRPGSFFEAEVKGSELHIAVGPRGRNISAKARPFPSEVAARAELERLAGLHRAKGYVDAVEVAPTPKGPTPQELIAQARDRSEWLAARQEQASNQARWKLVVDDALLAACEAAQPDDPSPWHIYADRLAAGDDPRGELALGMLRGLAWEGAIAVPVFLGRLVISLEVRHGFLRAIRIGGRELDELAKFLASPFAASLRMLRIGLGEQGDWTRALQVIAASPAGRRLRELEFDASDDAVRDSVAFHETCRPTSGLSEAQEREFYEAVGYNIRSLLSSVSPVRFGRDAPWSELALERLVIDGPFRGDLGTLALPALRELVIRSDRFSRVDELAAAQCPNLETLEIWFGDQVWSGDHGALDLTPLFERGVLPSLRTLRVFDADEVTLAMVRDSELAKRVELVTTPPEGARAARYAHPHQVERVRLNLPRGGEPPEKQTTTHG